MLNTIALPYQEGFHYLKKIYSAFAPVLLDSNKGDRYDIVTAEPTKYLLQSSENTFECHDRVQQSVSSIQLPLSDILESELPEEINDSELPFVGGWIGFMSYDYFRQLESIPTTLPKTISLPDVWFAYYDWAIISDHEQQTSVLVYDDAYEQSSLFNHFFKLLHTDSEQVRPFSLSSAFESSLSKEAYFEKFKHIKHYIYDGHIYQTNFSQRFSASYTGDPIAAYSKLRHNNPAPFGAYLRLHDDHWIASCSPERFIKIENQSIETNPIKGTRPRSDDPTVDAERIKELTTSTKDRAENLMIVDLLRNDLSRNSVPGTVRVPELFKCHSFKNVHHLISKITATLSPDSTRMQLILDAFPGGSVTGAPKIRAMEISEELEPVRRSLFCGNILYYSKHRQLDCNIVIRTAVFDKSSVYIWAGGGIVHDSTAESEYQETFDKVNIILNTLSEHHEFMSCE